jgi:hypothetical protein
MSSRSSKVISINFFNSFRLMLVRSSVLALWTFSIGAVLPVDKGREYGTSRLFFAGGGDEVGGMGVGVLG